MSDAILLLDVDGVVNVAGDQPHTHVWPAGSYLETTANCVHGLDWRICAAQPVLDFLRHVHVSGLAEVRWHTEWQQAALNVGAALKLPDFPIQPACEPGVLTRGKAWKQHAVLALLHEGRPVVWADDDAYSRVLESPLLLVVAPDPTAGLTAEHLNKIEAFLTATATEE